MQAAVGGSTENTGPAWSPRATSPSSDARRDRHRIGQHQRADVHPGSRRAARCRRARGRAARFSPPLSAPLHAVQDHRRGSAAAGGL
ncbi:MAG: hypothetical protein MZV65_32950 [Chromatiales bacterium]|nr:hypothetical protein [Chromatiales bacterium]